MGRRAAPTRPLTPPRGGHSPPISRLGCAGPVSPDEVLPRRGSDRLVTIEWPLGRRTCRPSRRTRTRPHARGGAGGPATRSRQGQPLEPTGEKMMGVFHRQEGFGDEAGSLPGDGEVSELSLLLPAEQLAALERAARQADLTVAHLVHSLVQGFLGQGQEEAASRPTRRRPRGQAPAAPAPGRDGLKRAPTADGGDSLEQWAAAFEAEARALLAGRAPDADGCRVRAVRCARHGPACACVIYGMFRGHYDW